MIGSRSLGALQGGGSAIDVPVAALAGLSIAFLAFAAPADLLADLIGSSGLPSILPAAQPPLGFKARIGIGAAGALIVFALAFILLRWLDRLGSREPAPARNRVVAGSAAELPAPRRRRRDQHPDAPDRAPLLARDELGEPALDPWPEPQATPKRASDLVQYSEPEPRWTPEPESHRTPEPEAHWPPAPEPQSTPEPEPQSTPELAQTWEPEPQSPPALARQPESQWTPPPEPQSPPESAQQPEPRWTQAPEPQSTPEPESPWPSAPEPPAEPNARPGPVIELVADPVENTWHVSRPYDPIVREKHPSAQSWPQLEDEDEDAAELEEEEELEEEAEAEDEPEAEDETEAGFEADPVAEEVGLVGSPWQFRGEPEVAPQAESADQPLADKVPEPQAKKQMVELPRTEPAPARESEPPAAAAPPPLEHSVEALLERLEQGMARRRVEPVAQAPDAAPVAQAPAARQPAMPDLRDDRLQSAIENLQRLAARRD